MFDRISFWYDGKYIHQNDVVVEYSKEYHGLFLKSGNDGFYRYTSYLVDKIYNLNVE